jgi:hypothetical protein
MIVAALLLSLAAKNVRADPPALSMAEIAGQWGLRAKVAKNVRYQIIGTKTIARGRYTDGTPGSPDLPDLPLKRFPETIR